MKSQQDERLLRRLAKAIKAQRLKVGRTQQDIAVAAGLSVRHYQELESGRLNASMPTLHTVAVALGTELSDIVRRIENGK